MPVGSSGQNITQANSFFLAPESLQLSLFVLTNCSVFIHIQEELKHFWERSSERGIWQIWCRALGKARRTQSPFTFANSSREPLLCQGITPKCSDSSLKLFTDTARTVYSHWWEWEGTGCCYLGNQSGVMAPHQSMSLLPLLGNAGVSQPTGSLLKDEDLMHWTRNPETDANFQVFGKSFLTSPHTCLTLWVAMIMTPRNTAILLHWPFKSLWIPPTESFRLTGKRFQN